MVDDLDSGRLRERLTGEWGSSLTVLQTTTSTMDDASKAAQAGAIDGHVILADQQTHGRGAHGRHWISPPGTDLYFSIVCRPDVEPSSMALITLAVGLGVRDAVAALLPARAVTVKWPNDVWVGRRKCAGVLVESRMVGTRIEAVIIGVGLNVNRRQWPPELEGLATSIRIERGTDAVLDRADVLTEVLFDIERWVKHFIKDGARVLVDALRPNLALVGEEVRWEDGHGVLEGIDERGAARVRTEKGIVTLHAARIEPASA